MGFPVFFFSFSFLSEASECTNSERTPILLNGLSFELLQSQEETIYVNIAVEKEKKKKAGHSWLLFPLAKNGNGLTILLFMATQTTLFEKSLISKIAVDMFSSTEQFRRKKLFY